jgi:hypothetical protein
MKKRQQLLSYIETAERNRNDITNSNNMLIQLVGEESDSNMRMTSNYYSYIIWIFIVIFIISLTIAASANDGEKVTSITYVIVAIFVLMFLIYMYRTFANISITY